MEERTTALSSAPQPPAAVPASRNVNDVAPIIAPLTSSLESYPLALDTSNTSFESYPLPLDTSNTSFGTETNSIFTGKADLKASMNFGINDEPKYSLTNKKTIEQSNVVDNARKTSKKSTSKDIAKSLPVERPNRPNSFSPTNSKNSTLKRADKSPMRIGIPLSPAERGIPKTQMEQLGRHKKGTSPQLNVAKKSPTSRGGRFGNIVDQFEENVPGPLAHFEENYNSEIGGNENIGNTRVGVSGPFAMSREKILFAGSKVKDEKSIKHVKHIAEDKNVTEFKDGKDVKNVEDMTVNDMTIKDTEIVEECKVDRGNPSERVELEKNVSIESEGEWPEPPPLEVLNSLMAEADLPTGDGNTFSDDKLRSNCSKLQRSQSLNEIDTIKTGFGDPLKSLRDSKEGFYNDLNQITKECRADSSNLKELFKDLTEKVAKYRNEEDNSQKAGKILRQKSSSESRLPTYPEPLEKGSQTTDIITGDDKKGSSFAAIFRQSSQKIDMITGDDMKESSRAAPLRLSSQTTDIITGDNNKDNSCAEPLRQSSQTIDISTGDESKGSSLTTPLRQSSQTTDIIMDDDSKGKSRAEPLRKSSQKTDTIISDDAKSNSRTAPVRQSSQKTDIITGNDVKGSSRSALLRQSSQKTDIIIGDHSKSNSRTAPLRQSSQKSDIIVGNDSLGNSGLDTTLSIRDQIRRTRQLAKQSQSQAPKKERNEYNSMRKATRSSVQPRNFAKPVGEGVSRKASFEGITKTDEEYFKSLQIEARRKSSISSDDGKSALSTSNEGDEETWRLKEVEIVKNLPPIDTRNTPPFAESFPSKPPTVPAAHAAPVAPAAPAAPAATNVISSIRVMPRSNSLSRMEIQIESGESPVDPIVSSARASSPSASYSTRHLEHIEGTLYDPLVYKDQFSGSDMADFQREELIKKIIAEKEKATANIDAMLKNIEQQLDMTEAERGKSLEQNQVAEYTAEIVSLCKKDYSANDPLSSATVSTSPPPPVDDLPLVSTIEAASDIVSLHRHDDLENDPLSSANGSTPSRLLIDQLPSAFVDYSTEEAASEIINSHRNDEFENKSLSSATVSTPLPLPLVDQLASASTVDSTKEVISGVASSRRNEDLENDFLSSATVSMPPLSPVDDQLPSASTVRSTTEETSLAKVLSSVELPSKAMNSVALVNDWKTGGDLISKKDAAILSTASVESELSLSSAATTCDSSSISTALSPNPNYSSSAAAVAATTATTAESSMRKSRFETFSSSRTERTVVREGNANELISISEINANLRASPEPTKVKKRPLVRRISSCDRSQSQVSQGQKTEEPISQMLIVDSHSVFTSSGGGAAEASRGSLHKSSSQNLPAANQVLTPSSYTQLFQSNGEETESPL